MSHLSMYSIEFRIDEIQIQTIPEYQIFFLNIWPENNFTYVLEYDSFII